MYVNRTGFIKANSMDNDSYSHIIMKDISNNVSM